MRYWLLAVLFCVGCEGIPQTAPTVVPVLPPPAGYTGEPCAAPCIPSITGHWSGPLQMTLADQRITVDTAADLVSDDTQVHGTWTVTTGGNDIRGEVTATMRIAPPYYTLIDGTVTWDTPQQGATGRCRGTATFLGAPSSIRIEWVSQAGVDWGGTCSGAPTNIRWSLGR